jgi:hypothetical protein
MEREKMKLFLLTLTVAILTSCTNDPHKLDKFYVGDSRGNIYKVKAHYGDTYFLKKCDLVREARCIVYLKDE